MGQEAQANARGGRRGKLAWDGLSITLHSAQPPRAPSVISTCVLTKCSQHQCVSSQYMEGGFGLETSMR
jgi:hypothetical protein